MACFWMWGFDLFKIDIFLYTRIGNAFSYEMCDEQYNIHSIKSSVATGRAQSNQVLQLAEHNTYKIEYLLTIPLNICLAFPKLVRLVI